MKNNLDIYIVDYDKDQFNKALQRVKKDSLTNILYLDCKSLLKNDNNDIANNLFDICFISEESNIIVLFTKGIMKRQEIEATLNKNKIKNTIVDFHYFKEYDENEPIKEEIHKQNYWFVRDGESLVSALKDSFKKGLSSCSYVSDLELNIDVGYKDQHDNYHTILNQEFIKGIITFKDKEIFLINRRGSKKFNQQAIEDILKRNFVRYKVIKQNKRR